MYCTKAQGQLRRRALSSPLHTGFCIYQWTRISPHRAEQISRLTGGKKAATVLVASEFKLINEHLSKWRCLLRYSAAVYIFFSNFLCSLRLLHAPQSLKSTRTETSQMDITERKNNPFAPSLCIRVQTDRGRMWSLRRVTIELLKTSSKNESVRQTLLCNKEPRCCSIMKRSVSESQFSSGKLWRLSSLSHISNLAPGSVLVEHLG